MRDGEEEREREREWDVLFFFVRLVGVERENEREIASGK